MGRLAQPSLRAGDTVMGQSPVNYAMGIIEQRFQATNQHCMFDVQSSQAIPATTCSWVDYFAGS